MFVRILFAATALCVALQPQSPRAEDRRGRTDYTIALAGLPLAYAEFQSRLGDDGYAISARIKSSGIAGLIAKTSAEIVTEGRVRNGRLSPERYVFQYRYGKKKRLFDTQFRSGDVISSVIEPKPQGKRRKNWVAIRPEHLLSVTDPVSGLVMPATADPCQGRIAVYDGEARIDLVLSPNGRKSFRAEGFDGETRACGLRYEPKSGYRRGHKEIDYVRRLQSMEIWFAKSDAMNVYAPVFLSVPTKYGTLTVTATHFDG